MSVVGQTWFGFLPPELGEVRRVVPFRGGRVVVPSEVLDIADILALPEEIHDNALPDGDRLTMRSIQRNLKEYLRQAKLDPSGFSPHSFRHAFGKRAALSQMYPPLLQSLLGHRNPNSSQVYYNVQNEALRQEYHTKLGDMRTEKVLAQISNKPKGNRIPLNE